MSIYIERVIQAVENIRAFDQRDAERLADELRALPPDAFAQHIAERLKNLINRDAAIDALREVL